MSESEQKQKPSRQPKLPRDVRQKIGQQMRAYYDEVVLEPLPDKLRELAAAAEMKIIESEALRG